MNDGVVCYISRPLDSNMKCQDHPNGCGFHLQLGDVLFVDGSEMELVKGSIFTCQCGSLTIRVSGLARLA